jgi:hypothetical protein
VCTQADLAQVLSKHTEVAGDSLNNLKLVTGLELTLKNAAIVSTRL